MRNTSARLQRILLRFVSIGVGFTILLPSAGALSVTTTLNAADTQRVTRGDFLRAAVKASGLPTSETGVIPYDGVPDALKPYVRAAGQKKILAVFAAEGRTVNFQKQLLRGEALEMIEAILAGVPSADAKTAAKKYTDVTTDAQRTLAALAVERNWMKPLSETLFGLSKTLRGKEAKLLLTRAFQISASSDGTETLSTPVIRIKLLGTTHEPAPKSEMLENVWNALRRNYLYRDRLTVDKAGDKAIEGLVNSLGDPYTVYLPKAKNEDFKQQMKGEVEGIGATVEMTGGVLTIVSPLRSSPAEKAGLLPKDQILSVDGENLNGLTLDDAVRHVRGPRGSSAVLKIRRPSDPASGRAGNGSEFDVTVTRDKVMIPEVEVLEDRNVSIVKIMQFWDTTDTKFRTMMAEIQGKNPRGIILDLRNNPGGLLHAAGTVVSAFLPTNSSYVSIMEIDATRSETTDDDPVVKDSIPMIVLVNKGSASASEIVAGALQDAGRAKVVGETTYGKGTVQQVSQFPDGSSLKYTIAEWRTPLGRKIDKLGVTPDVIVSNQGAPQGKDLQMEKAMELLR